MLVNRPSAQGMLKQSLRWLMVFLMIALSGCVYFTQIYRIAATVCFAAVMSFSLLLEHQGFTRRSMWTAIGCLFALLVNFYLNGSRMTGANVADYGLLAVELLCVAGAVSLISAEEFASKYVRIMEIISVISLICFAVQRSNPDLVYRLANPSILNGYAVSWYHTWGWTYIFERNAGPFWEPAAFQGYLFVALLFLLRRNDVEKHGGGMLLLGITVLTTMSTTGYILLGIAGIYFCWRYARENLRWRNDMKWVLVKLSVLFGGMLIGVAYLLTSDTVVSKFSLSNASFVIRMQHLAYSFAMVMESPFTGFGIMTQDLLDMWSIFGEPTNSAGLLVIFQYFGLVLGSLYIGVSLAATMKVFQPLNRFFLCIFFLILHLTESLMTFPVYFGFIFLAANMPKNEAAHKATWRARR